MINKYLKKGTLCGVLSALALTSTVNAKNIAFGELDFGEEEVEVGAFYIKPLEDDYTSGWHNDLKAKKPKKVPGDVFFWGPMSVDVYAHRRTYGKGSSIIKEDLRSDMLTHRMVQRLHQAQTIEEIKAASLKVNSTGYTPSASTLGEGRFIDDTSGRFYQFTNGNVTALHGKIPLVVGKGRHDVTLTFSWRHQLFGKGQGKLLADVKIGGKQVYVGDNLDYTFEYTFKNKKRTPYELSYKVTCEPHVNTRHYKGFSKFEISGFAGNKPIPFAKRKVINRIDAFGQGNEYTRSVMSVIEVTEGGTKRKEGNITFDLNGISVLTPESQATGLRHGVHDRQYVIKGEFIPKKAGYYEFGIGTQTNVCTVTHPDLEALQNPRNQPNKHSPWNNSYKNVTGNITPLIEEHFDKTPQEIFSMGRFSHGDLGNYPLNNEYVYHACKSQEDGADAYLAGASVNVMFNGEFVGNNGAINAMRYRLYGGGLSATNDRPITFGDTGYQTVPVYVSKNMVGEPVEVAFHVSSNITYGDTKSETFTYSTRYGAALFDVGSQKGKPYWASDRAPGYQNVYLTMRAPNEIYYRPFTAEDFVPIEATGMREVEIEVEIVEIEEEQGEMDWETSLMDNEEAEEEDIFGSTTDNELGILEDEADEGSMSLDAVDNLFGD